MRVSRILRAASGLVLLHCGVDLSATTRLNKAYQQVVRQLATEPEQRTALRRKQRSWLKAWDYDCKVDQQTIDSTCLVMRTAVRTNELESQIRF